MTFSLHSAAQNGDLDAIRDHLHDDPSSIDSRDIVGQTPLHFAVWAGHLDVSRYLIENGANIDAQDNLGTTPLHLAAKIKNPELARLLLSKSVSPDLPDQQGFTPLHVAVEESSLSLAELLLLDERVDVNTYTKDGLTPLHYAVKHANSKVVQLLLDKDADVNARTPQKWTPLHYAAERGNESIVDRLVQCRSKINAQDNEGCTPLTIAKVCGHDALVQILRQNEATEPSDKYFVHDKLSLWQDHFNAGLELSAAHLCPDAPPDLLNQLDRFIRIRKERAAPSTNDERPIQFQLAPNVKIQNSHYLLLEPLPHINGIESWKAENRMTGERCVIRFLRPLDDRLKDHTNLEEICERLQAFPPHKSLGSIIDFGVRRDFLFLAYRLVENKDRLTDLIQEYWTSMTPLDISGVIYRLAQALQAAHSLESPLVHGGIEPNCILCSEHDEFHIDGFGLSLLSSQSASSPYCSFEQAQQHHIPNPSDDIHALGVIWCELLGLRHLCEPFPPSYREDYDWETLREQFIHKELTSEQANVVLSCLKRHSSRLPNAQALMQEIQQVFLSIRDQIENDAKEVERLRTGGEDWITHHREVAKNRLSHWNQGVSEGIAAALWLNGLCFENGHPGNTLVDLEVAAKLFRNAANQGFSSAQYDLAMYYEHGLGNRQPNKAKAAELYQQAANQGHRLAQYELGVCYLEGKGVEKNLDRAKHWFRLAADAEHPEASFQLWKLTGKSSQKLLRQASNGGVPEACYRRGQKLLNQSHPKDQESLPRATFTKLRGQMKLKQAAEAGHLEAQYVLGKMKIDQWEDLGRSQENIQLLRDGLRFLRNAAKRGHAEASYTLASAYYHGDGLPSLNKSHAFSYLRQAAEAGHIEAQKALDEEWVDHDPELLKWLIRAAEKGCEYAQRKLALLRGEFGEGQALAIDEELVAETESLYEQAARTGDSAAARRFLHLRRNRKSFE